MCGRYTQLFPWQELVAFFRVENLDFRPNLPPRYNLAPTQDAPIVRLSAAGQRELALARWGLIPAWAKDAAVGARTINARSETAAEKPSFRAAYRARRCLVPANGFYEWQKHESGKKQPYYIALADGGPMTFAGLWETWRDPADGRSVDSYTILTTEATAQLRTIHHRMPVILDPKDFDLWLEPKRGDAAALFVPYTAAVTAVPVSSAVNKAWDSKTKTIVDHEGLIQPLPDEPPPAAADTGLLL